MDQHIRGALLLTVIVLGLAACAAAPSVSPAPSLPFTELPHDAPELEAVLPRSIQGRQIATWSMAGASWVALATGEAPAKVESLINEDMASNGGNPVDVDNLALAIGGRSNTDTDPPYFVWAAQRPIAEGEIELAAFLMFGAADFTDPVAAGDLDRYDKRTIAGKVVYVGSPDMVEQNEHQRGRPYLYENDDYMFLVLTDDDAWAEEALAALP
jgi:hypothetical protein